MKSLSKIGLVALAGLLCCGCQSDYDVYHVDSIVSYAIQSMDICGVDDQSVLLDDSGVRIWGAQKYLSRFSFNVNLQSEFVLANVQFSVSLYSGDHKIGLTYVDLMILNPEDSCKVYVDLPAGASVDGFRVESVKADKLNTTALNCYYKFGEQGLYQVSNSTYKADNTVKGYVAMIDTNGLVVDSLFIDGKGTYVSTGANISSYEVILGGELSGSE